ncbi:MAG: rhodanese-like domain-containing protein [Thermodesulfobacteriota bacterium]|nr:rhodanese-like domain-containing protein [Thermodesulfobacteriota bacterium]
MRKQMFVKKSFVISIVLFFALSLSALCLAGMTSDDFVKEAKKTAKEISVADAKADIDAGKAIIILDCRTVKEFKAGHLPKAINIPRGLLEFKVEKKIPNKTSYVICYCKTGGRSCLSTSTLGQMGYTNIKSLAGGWKAWIAAGYPVE